MEENHLESSASSRETGGNAGKSFWGTRKPGRALANGFLE